MRATLSRNVHIEAHRYKRAYASIQRIDTPSINCQCHDAIAYLCHNRKAPCVAVILKNKIKDYFYSQRSTGDSYHFLLDGPLINSGFHAK